METGRITFSLIIGIFLLIYLIIKTKIHPFIALIGVSAAIGVMIGMPFPDVVDSITKGFGTTLGSIGIIIGFGVMMGEVFNATGAANTMAEAFIRLFGKKREELAMAITGFIVSIPIFCDSAFVVLAPLFKGISKSTSKSVISLGVALGIGLLITHSLVPPTPGPLAVASMFNINIGTFLFYGILLALPLSIIGVLYGKWVGRKIYQLPGENDEWIRLDYKQYQYKPVNFDAPLEWKKVIKVFTPIIVPVLLILLNTVSGLLSISPEVLKVFDFLGSPVIAVGIGLVLSIYLLTPGIDRKTTLGYMEKGLKSAGIIILVTGGGGALGMVLRDSNAGEFLAMKIVDSGLPLFLLPFIVSSLIRLIQGSGTIAMITSASITAPMVLQLGVNPVIAALGASLGALLFSYFNDSYFWVVTRMLGLDNPKEQIKVWSVTTTLCWFAGLIFLIILNMFI